MFIIFYIFIILKYEIVLLIADLNKAYTHAIVYTGAQNIYRLQISSNQLRFLLDCLVKENENTYWFFFKYTHLVKSNAQKTHSLYYFFYYDC